MKCEVNSMKKILLIVVTVVCLFSQVNSIIAEEDEKTLVFSSSVTNQGESILFNISDDYAEQTPKVKLDCEIENAAVYAPDGSLVTSVLSEGSIVFNVTKGGGTYTIQKAKPSSKTYQLPKTGIE